MTNALVGKRELANAFRGQTHWVALSVLATLVNAFVSASSAFLSGSAIVALQSGHTADCLRLAGLMLAAIAFTGALSASEAHLFAIMTESAGAALRSRLYAKMLGIPLSEVRERGPGELLNRVDSDVDSLVSSLENVVAPTVSEGITLVVTLGLMLHADWRLTLVVVTLSPFWFIVVRLATPSLRNLRRDVLALHDELLALCSEVLCEEGVTLICTTNSSKSEVERFDRLFAKLVRLRLRMSAISQLTRGALTIVVALGPSMLILAASILVPRGYSDAATTIAFLGLQARLFSPLSHFSSLQIEIANIDVTLSRVSEILESVDIPTGQHATISSPDILVENLSVSTDGRLVLHPLSFSVAAGQTAALSGPSGSGKSTLAAVLLRLIEPTAGCVQIGGVELSSFHKDDLHTAVALVPQQPYFFRRSIRENLTLGADVDEQIVADAINIAGARELIQMLPSGIEEQMYGEYSRFSGGELQRLAIARAIIRRPSLLILDEATSALDEATETLVLGNLSKALSGTTVLHISHRAAVVASADIVVYIAPESVAVS